MDADRYDRMRDDEFDRGLGEGRLVAMDPELGEHSLRVEAAAQEKAL